MLVNPDQHREKLPEHLCLCSLALIVNGVIRPPHLVGAEVRRSHCNWRSKGVFLCVQYPSSSDTDPLSCSSQCGCHLCDPFGQRWKKRFFSANFSQTSHLKWICGRDQSWPETRGGFQNVRGVGIFFFKSRKRQRNETKSREENKKIKKRDMGRSITPDTPCWSWFQGRIQINSQSFIHSEGKREVTSQEPCGPNLDRELPLWKSRAQRSPHLGKVKRCKIEALYMTKNMLIQWRIHEQEGKQKQIWTVKTPFFWNWVWSLKIEHSRKQCGWSAHRQTIGGAWQLTHRPMLTATMALLVSAEHPNENSPQSSPFKVQAVSLICPAKTSLCFLVSFKFYEAADKHTHTHMCTHTRVLVFSNSCKTLSFSCTADPDTPAAMKRAVVDHCWPPPLPP